MALIGTIDISVNAQTRPLQRGLRRARGELQSFGGSLRNAFTGVRAAIAAATAAVAGFTIAMRRAFQRLDDLGRVATRLGIAVEELEGLRNAAEAAGISSQTLDTALQRFSRRLAEAEKGTGGLKDVLDELGLSAEELARMPLDEAFLRFGESASEAETQGERLRRFMQAFDTEGAALVQVFDQGSEAIRRQTRLLRDWGLETTRSGTNNIQEFNQRMADFGAILTGVINKIATELAPRVVQLIDLMSELIGFTINLGKTIEAVFLGIDIQIASLLAQFEVLNSQIKALTAQMLSLGAVLAQVFGGDPEFVEALRQDSQRLGEESGKAFARAWSGEVAQEYFKTIQDSQAEWDELLAGLSEGIGDIVSPRQPFGAGLALAGTQEAARALNQPRNPLLEVAREELEVAERSERTLEEILGEIRNSDQLIIQNVMGAN